VTIDRDAEGGLSEPQAVHVRTVAATDAAARLSKGPPDRTRSTLTSGQLRPGDARLAESATTPFPGESCRSLAVAGPPARSNYDSL
jgi:hypothetical protein